MGNIAPLLCLLLLPILGNCESSNEQYAEWKALSSTEKAAITQLKGEVGETPHAWMKEDIYLMRYLQATSYDVPGAATMMKDMIKWREERKVDSWEKDEKINSLSSDFPSIEGLQDKDGRPSRQAPYGKWNILTAVAGGKFSTLDDYAIRSMERCTSKMRDQQAKGKDVTQWSILLDLSGYSPVNVACAGCVPLVKNYVKAYEQYYPNSAKEIILVNAPHSFNTFWTLIKTTMMKPETAALVTVFGSKKEDWQAYVNERFPSDQLASWFGGSAATPSGGGLAPSVG